MEVRGVDDGAEEGLGVLEGGSSAGGGWGVAIIVGERGWLVS